MKADTHPNYKDVTFTCACGAKFVAGSTIEKDFSTEICSNCHPFYTGKQKLVDTSGRVDKFMAKMKKAQEKAEKNVKKVDKGEEEEVAKEVTKKPKTEKKEEKTPEVAEAPEEEAPAEKAEEEKAA